MNKQLLIVVAVLAYGQLIVCQEERVEYGGPDEQPLNYKAPAVQPGQSQPGETRHSLIERTKGLAGVVGQNTRKTLQDAQPYLLGVKSDLGRQMEKIRTNPNVAKVRDMLPSHDTIVATAAKGQEKFGKVVSGLNERTHRYKTRLQEKLQQYQEQHAQRQQQRQQQQQGQQYVDEQQEQY